MCDATSGNFFSPKKPVVPNKKPKFSLGQTVRIDSPRHSASGKVGKISEINPNQSQVLYLVKLGEWAQMFPERMLKKL